MGVCRLSRIVILSARHVRHRSPRREPGDCDVAHQLERARLSGVVYVEWHGRSGLHRGVAGGVAFAPAVPGLAPGACMGQGEGLPVSSRRPCKQAQRRMP